MAASRYAGVLGPPAIFPQRRFADLEALTGDTGARALLREAGADVAAVDWPAGEDDLDRRDEPVSGYTSSG